MSRVTIEVQNAQDVHVSIPNWLFKLIGILMGLWVLFFAALLLFAGQPVPALGVASIGLAFIPLSLVITYIYWRFFWWLTAVLLFCSTASSMPPLIWMLLTGKLRSTVPDNLSLNAPIPIENIILFLVVILVVMVIIFLSRRSRKAKGHEPVTRDAPILEFDTAITRTFQERVAALVAQRSGCQTAIDTDIVRVYRGKNLVGVVKCIDKPGKPISPVMVREAQKLAERMGADTVYLASSGYFPNDARAEAARLSVKVIELA